VPLLTTLHQAVHVAQHHPWIQGPVVHQRMVVRGEQRAAVFAGHQMLHDCMGNGRAVEGRRTAAQFIQNT